MTTILDEPVQCRQVLAVTERPEIGVTYRTFCVADAYGPPENPRCATHGGPDIAECERCEHAITDDAEQFDCPRFSGPIHVGCHPPDCRSVECREALSDPTDYEE